MTIFRWSHTRSRRLWPGPSSLDVDEKMQRMENMISTSTMIQTTLSPSVFSKMFQNVFFFSAINCYSLLTASLNFSPRSS